MTSGMIVYVFTSEMDKLRRFYQDALGVQGKSTGPSWVEFPVAGGKFALHRQDPDDPQKTGSFRAS